MRKYLNSPMLRFRIAFCLLYALTWALESLSNPTAYTQLMTGKMVGRRPLLDKLTKTWVVVGDAGAGAITVNMLDTATTTTVSAGTIRTNTTNNVLTNLTGTAKLAIYDREPHQVNSMTSASDMLAIADQHADAIASDQQAQLVASLKSASLGSSVALATGYIDGAIPSAATLPDMINEFGKFQRAVDLIRSRNTGGSDSDLSIIATPTLWSNIKSVARHISLQAIFGKNGDAETFDGVDVFPLSATDFGGASNEAFFVIHRKAFALKGDDPYVWGGGWQNASDTVKRWTTVGPYFYGSADVTNFAAEITNPAS